MDCQWEEAVAHRFAEGTLDSQTEQAFAGHLPGCQACRERVAEARRLEGLLRAGITPLPVPAALASRVTGAVAADRERRRFAWPRFFGGRALSPVLAGLVAALALSLVSYAVAPGAVTALVRKVLFFVPGLGIQATEGTNLVGGTPVEVKVGDTVLTVEALLADGRQTMVRFTVHGLPGGKQGWATQGPGSRKPVLRDGTGHEYAIATGVTSVGGSPQENVIEGQASFAPLPAGLRSVELVVPMDYLVPPAVLPGSDQQEWVARIALAPADQSGLPEATPQDATATANGVTLRVAASRPTAQQFVLLLEGQVEKPTRLLALGRMGASPSEMALLRDEHGRTYNLRTPESSLSLASAEYRRNLYFAPLGAGAGRLTLTVPALQVIEQAEASVTISLQGRQIGDTFDLDREVDLGGHKVLLRSATLAFESSAKGADGPWLYVDVDPGPAASGRFLATFQAQRAGGSGTMWSLDQDSMQVDRFGIPVEPGAKEVTIELSNPQVIVEGPWELTFPVTGK